MKFTCMFQKMTRTVLKIGRETVLCNQISPTRNEEVEAAGEGTHLGQELPPGVPAASMCGDKRWLPEPAVNRHPEAHRGLVVDVHRAGAEPAPPPEV